MADFVRVREKVPFSGKGVEDVVTAVRAVLTNYKPQKITLEVGKPITVERLVPGDLRPDKESIHSILRNQPMVEYPFEEEEKTPLQHLCAMAMLIYNEGLELNRLLLGSKHEFQTWLGVTIPITHMTLLGVPVVVLPELDSETFILCGSEAETHDPEDIRFAVKGTIPS